MERMTTITYSASVWKDYVRSMVELIPTDEVFYSILFYSEDEGFMQT